MKKNFFSYASRIDLTIIAIAVILVVAAVAFFCYKTKDDDLSITVNGDIDGTPTLLNEIREIGQWEFLTISDEEMIDTIRKGIFSDDELIRIYYGTLRLGIDFSHADENWLSKERPEGRSGNGQSSTVSGNSSTVSGNGQSPTVSSNGQSSTVSNIVAIALPDTDGDSLYIDLPPVQLLDENFLDETRTKSFIEKGSWTNSDRKALADRARLAMRSRCLTQKNLDQAQRTANSQLALFLQKVLKK